MKVLFLFLIGICAARSAGAREGSAVTVYYEERAPYQVRSGDTLAGLTGAPAARAFQAAQLKVTWEASSMSRQLIMLRKNLTPSCVVGWFKTAERQKFAKFSKVLYRDGPVVGLVRPDFVFQPGHTVRDTLTTPGVRLLVRTGYVYGAYLDAQVRQANPVIVSSPLPNSQMSELLLAKRADIMFTTEEEAAQMLRHLGPKAAALQVRHFSDPIPSEGRHIACSAKVADDTIERINAALPGD